jgi:7-carboxy-7-deazaguanine synthase
VTDPPSLPSLVVSEVFGPTISGEGVTMGERCGFVRFMGCNLKCSWCDTPYTWDASRFNLAAEGHRMTWPAIVEELIAMDVGFVIISGGEPLLHQYQPAWELMLRALDGAGIRVEVETNGTVIPNEVSRRWVTRFTVSPKLAHSGDPEDKRIVTEALDTFRRMNQPDPDPGRAAFKFVCRTPDDVAEVQRWTKLLSIHRDYVWIMPEGVTSRALCDHLAVITDPAVAAGFNVTTRLHIHVWGDTRGH